MQTKDSFFHHRRTICGLRVLVNTPLDADTAIIGGNFAIRIKHPDGDIDRIVKTYYPWQAFNAARRIIESL